MLISKVFRYIVKSVSIYRQKSFEFQNDIFIKYLFRNYDHFSIKTQIFMIFDMFEIFDTICMCLLRTAVKVESPKILKWSWSI